MEVSPSGLASQTGVTLLSYFFLTLRLQSDVDPNRVESCI